MAGYRLHAANQLACDAKEHQSDIRTPSSDSATTPAAMRPSARVRVSVVPCDRLSLKSRRVTTELLPA